MLLPVAEISAFGSEVVDIFIVDKYLNYSSGNLNLKSSVCYDICG